MPDARLSHQVTCEVQLAKPDQTGSAIREEEKLPFKVKFAYGGAEGATTLAWSTFYVFYLYFLTDIAHVPASTAGLIMMIATIWDAITDPAVGIWSDRVKSPYGRRRPFIAVTALPFALSIWLVFTDFRLKGVANTVYFIFAVMLFFTCMTLIGVPYTALAAEMTSNYDERGSLAIIRVGWSQVFTIIAAACTLILTKYFSSVLGNTRAGWSATAALYGAFGIFPLFLTWRFTRGYELHPKEVSIRFADVFRCAFRNKPFLYTLGAYAFGACALNTAAAILVYFTKYNMKMTEEKSSLVLLLLFATTLLWVPIIALVTKRMGKRASYMLFTSVWAVTQAIGVLFLKPGMDIFLYVIIVLAAGGVTVIPFVAWSMVPDAVEVDEFKTGQRREGLYFGITGVMQKAAVALVLWLVGLSLSWIGYVADARQSPSTLTGIKLLFAWGPSIFLILSITLTVLLPMTRERHEALKEAIRQKKEGSPLDPVLMEKINKLL